MFNIIKKHLVIFSGWYGFAILFAVMTTLSLSLHDNRVTNLTGDVGKITSVRVLYPKGGELLKEGEVVTLKWRGGKEGDKAYLYLFDKSRRTQVVAAPVPNTGEYEWTIPDKIDGEYKLKVRIGRKSAISERFFTIQSLESSEKEKDLKKAPYHQGPSSEPSI